MDAAHFFGDRVPALLATHGALLNGHVVCTFKIAGDGGGEWTLDLRSVPPVCTPGGSASSLLTIETDNSSFEQILADQRLLVDMYYRGQLKLSGNFATFKQVGDILTLLASPPRADIGLSHLMAPLEPTRFLRDYWPNKHVVVHGDPARLQSLSDLPILQSARTFLETWPGLVFAFPPGSGDEFDAPRVTAKEALVLFERGCALNVSNVEAHVPVLRTYLDNLVRDLGLPASVHMRCLCYLTPAGAGASPHFDQNANFVVQLTGEKIWHVAPNRQVTNPTARHAMSFPEPYAELLFQATGPFPTEMPADAETITLVPGSVLFVPNSMWHATTSNGPSLSLNFTFDQPNWADLVCEALRRRLVWDPKWRELATNANLALDEDRKILAQTHVAALLKEVPRVLGQLHAGQIVNMFPKPKPDDTVDLKRSWSELLTAK
jgi:50S ribosomal protein L16 3-hydroxylase